MITYISMLRGINVSGQKKIRMEALRSTYEKLELANVQTYLQSGNVVFDSTEGDPDRLAKQIEAQIEQDFGFSVPVLIRTGTDFLRIISQNPFLTARSEDPSHLYVTFLYDSPAPALTKQINFPGEGDEFVIGEKEVFLFCPNGYGRTKLNNNFFEKKLKLLATTRNWKTVNALYELTQGR